MSQIHSQTEWIGFFVHAISYFYQTGLRQSGQQHSVIFASTTTTFPPSFVIMVSCFCVIFIQRQTKNKTKSMITSLGEIMNDWV